MRWTISGLLLLILELEAGASLAPRTGDVVVGTYTSGFRINPSVTATTGGQFIVVWEDTRPDVEGGHILGRKFDADGALLGTEFQVDASGSVLASGPSIAPAGNGDFVVVWRSDPNDDETRPRLLGQRIGEDGAAIGTEFQVNSPRTLGDTYYYLSHPALAPAAGAFGGFVVVWSSGTLGQGFDDYFGPTSEIYERHFEADATPSFFEEVVSSPAGDQYTRAEIAPDIATLADGFIVTWAKGYFSGVDSTFQTVARRLYPSGQPRGTEFVVGSNGATGPQVAARNPAGFSVAWSTYQFVDYIPHGGGEVVARTFSAFDQPLGEQLLISMPATGLDPFGDPRRPYAGVNGIAAATSSSGEFVVTWASGAVHFAEPYYGGSTDGFDSGIFARQFARDDTATGPERQVNFTGEGDQKRPDAAFGDADTVAVVWDAEVNGDFAPDAIYARVFDVITPACGDADEDGAGTTSDALFVLQAAVGVRTCAACLCDVNASGAQTAADALIVLQAAVGSGPQLACPACEPPAVTFALQSDVLCYGAHVEIPTDALPHANTLERCGADPSLALLGCTLSLASANGSLTFDARGCFLDPAELFACGVSQSEAGAMAQASRTACGCGCADSCPTTPVLCAQVDGQPACAAATLKAVNTHPTVSVVSETHTETVTSSTTCGTCCDYFEDATLSLLETDSAVTELVLRFDSRRDVTCSDDAACDLDPAIEGPSYARFVDDGTIVEVCIADPEGISGPAPLGQCSFTTGSVVPGPAEIVRALGPDLKPLELAPPVAVQ